MLVLMMMLMLMNLLDGRDRIKQIKYKKDQSDSARYISTLFLSLLDDFETIMAIAGDVNVELR
jgi:hypothetical protein